MLHKMAAVVEMLQTFTSDVDCPTGATGLKAYLPVMNKLLPEGRRRITPDSTAGHPELHANHQQHERAETDSSFPLTGRRP